MGLFDFLKRSKFSKMSAQEKSREQRYANLLCIEISSLANRRVTLEDKMSDEDFKILTIAAKAINIGSEYFDCELRKNYLANLDEGDKHFQEVLSSLNIKTKRATIKQMLLVHSNIEKLENLLDENGDIIFKSRYMTPIEKTIFQMGINEELEGLIKNMIYEINNHELNDTEQSNSDNDLTKMFSFKQCLAILETVLFVGSINELSDEQNEFMIEIASALQIHPDSVISLPQFERSNLLKDLNLEQNNYIFYLINEMLELDKVSSINDNQELFQIMTEYSLNGSNTNKLSFKNDRKELDAKNLKITGEHDKHDNALSLFNSGKHKYNELKDYEGALSDYNKSIEINPNYSDTYYNRGILKKVLKDYQGALDDYNKAIELDPESRAYRYRGGIKQILNDYQGALDDYTIDIEKFSNNWVGYNNRGQLKFELKDYQGALEDFNKSIKINPRIFRKSLLGRGDSKLKLDDFKGAIVDYNKVIELDPKNKEALQNRSIAKIKLESVSEN